MFVQKVLVRSYIYSKVGGYGSVLCQDLQVAEGFESFFSIYIGLGLFGFSVVLFREIVGFFCFSI